jgi:hypothetical protein
MPEKQMIPAKRKRKIRFDRDNLIDFATPIFSSHRQDNSIT